MPSIQGVTILMSIIVFSCSGFVKCSGTFNGFEIHWPSVVVGIYVACPVCSCPAEVILDGE